MSNGSYLISHFMWKPLLATSFGKLLIYRYMLHVNVCYTIQYINTVNISTFHRFFVKTAKLLLSGTVLIGT